VTADRIFGVDGNFYLHRVVHTQSFEPKDEALSQSKRLLGMICKDAAAVGARRVFVAFDGWAIFRHKVYEGYKESRKDNGPSGVYDHLTYIKDFLMGAGLPVAHDKKYEADDWMRSLIAQYQDVVVGCRDKDSYQGLIKKGVFLYDSSTKPKPTKIYPRDVEALFGVPPELCLDFQTLVGDKIDCIPQLMKSDEAKKGLRKHKSIRAWAAASPSMMKWCRRHQGELNRNRKLVKLKTDLPVEVPPIKWIDNEELATKSYFEYRKVATIKTRGLFS
jgi:DNA polymerase-1